MHRSRYRRSGPVAPFSGLTTLNKNQKVSFELERGANGKISSANLKAL